MKQQNAKKYKSLEKSPTKCPKSEQDFYRKKSPDSIQYNHQMKGMVYRKNSAGKTALASAIYFFDFAGMLVEY